MNNTDPTPRNKNGTPFFLLFPTIKLLLIKLSTSPTINVFLPSSFASELNLSITKVPSSPYSTPHSPAISFIGSPKQDLSN